MMSVRDQTRASLLSCPVPLVPSRPTPRATRCCGRCSTPRRREYEQSAARLRSSARGPCGRVGPIPAHTRSLASRRPVHVDAPRRRVLRSSAQFGFRLPSRPASGKVAICRASGSRKTDTSIPAAVRRFTAAATPGSFATTSSPPSVVNSCRRSGTSVASSGLISHAIVTISSTQASSRFNRLVTTCRKQAHVSILNMPPILSKMHGDAVRARRAVPRLRRQLGRVPRRTALAAPWRHGRCLRQAESWETQPKTERKTRTAPVTTLQGGCEVHRRIEGGRSGAVCRYRRDS